MRWVRSILSVSLISTRKPEPYPVGANPNVIGHEPVIAMVAEGLVTAIASLPGDREFANAGEVAEALGIPGEAHRF